MHYSRVGTHGTLLLQELLQKDAPCQMCHEEWQAHFKTIDKGIPPGHQLGQLTCDP